MLFFPESPAAAAETLKAAAAAGRRVAPFGRGSSLPRAWAEDEGLACVCLRNLDAVSSAEPENLLAVVEAGLTPARLAEALRPSGLYWPVTGLEERSLGGLMAEGLLGAETMAKGTAADWLLGATLIGADGEMATSGGRTLKNASGYDFTRLIWRSRGRLALATSFILKLWPLPESAPVLEYAFPDPPAAAEAARRVLLARTAPEALRLTWDERGPRLLAWLAGFAAETAAREAALEALIGRRPDARHEDGFEFWRARGRAWPSGGAGLLAYGGARRDLLAWAAAREARPPRADVDLGGGRLTIPSFAGLSPAWAERLAPAGFFCSSGPVYERLKAGLDPENVFLA